MNILLFNIRCLDLISGKDDLFTIYPESGNSEVYIYNTDKLGPGIQIGGNNTMYIGAQPPHPGTGAARAPAPAKKPQEKKKLVGWCSRLFFNMLTFLNSLIRNHMLVWSTALA